MSGVCPNCGAPLGGLNTRHCPACGQRLTASPGSFPPPTPTREFEPSFAQIQQEAMTQSTPSPAKAPLGVLPTATRWLGGASIFFLPLSLLAIPLGLVSLSAIAQGKAPRSGIWPSVLGVFLGAWGFFWLVLSLKLFSAIGSMVH